MSTFDATIFDHALTMIIVLALPIGGWYSINRVRRQLAEGIPYTSRITDYRNNIVIMWSVTFAALSLCFALGRDFAVLGFLPPGGGYGNFGFAVLLFATMVGFGATSEYQVRNSEKAAKGLVTATRDFEFALPHSRRDLAWFYGISVTAGVTEEILYRGFLIAYLSGFMPTLPAILVSTAAFGLAHSYQGPVGIVRTFLVGLALAAMYVLSGSLLLPIIAHVLVDIFGGRAIYHAYNQAPPAATPQEAC